MVRAAKEHIKGARRSPGTDPGWVMSSRGVEATTGFEPVNNGFADHRLRPLGYVAQTRGRSHPCRIVLAAPRGFEPRFTDPKSGVLPLDEGASE